MGQTDDELRHISLGAKQSVQNKATDDTAGMPTSHSEAAGHGATQCGRRQGWAAGRDTERRGDIMEGLSAQRDLDPPR